MNLQQIKLLAGSLRSVLQKSRVRLERSDALEMVAASVCGQNWASIRAVRNWSDDIEFDMAAATRLAQAIGSSCGIDYPPDIVLAKLAQHGNRAIAPPSLSAEVRQEDLPKIFRRFSEVIGERAWLDQAVQIELRMQLNPFLAEYLESQHSLVFALKRLSEASASSGGTMPWAITAEPNLMESFVFASQMLELIEGARRVAPRYAELLVDRVRDALRYSTAVQALQLEARVATHYTRLGHTVRFPELGGGKEKFDLLIESLGSNGLEIECKAITKDKGRKIHREEALEFLNLAVPRLKNLSTGLIAGLGVVVTIPKRMPSTEDLESFANAVLDQVFIGKSGVLGDGTHVRVLDFDPVDIGPMNGVATLENMKAVGRITGTTNRECVVYREPGSSGVVVMVIQSAQPDSMLHEVFATLADSAGNQLSGNRGGAFIGGLEGLSREALLRVAMGDRQSGVPSHLAWEVSKFLRGEEFPHVVGVGFLSAPDYAGSIDVNSAQGVAYYFPRSASPFWHPDFSGMFGDDPPKLPLVSID